MKFLFRLLIQAFFILSISARYGRRTPNQRKLILDDDAISDPTLIESRIIGHGIGNLIGALTGGTIGYLLNGNHSDNSNFLSRKEKEIEDEVQNLNKLKADRQEILEKISENVKSAEETFSDKESEINTELMKLKLPLANYMTRKNKI